MKFTWAVFKIPLSFHDTGWFIRIPLLDYHNCSNDYWVVFHPRTNYQPTIIHKLHPNYISRFWMVKFYLHDGQTSSTKRALAWHRNRSHADTKLDPPLIWSSHGRHSISNHGWLAAEKPWGSAGNPMPRSLWRWLFWGLGRLGITGRTDFDGAWSSTGPLVSEKHASNWCSSGNDQQLWWKRVLINGLVWGIWGGQIPGKPHI